MMKEKQNDKNMSARYAEVNFDDDNEFEPAVRFEREATAEKFSELKEELLADLLEETEALSLLGRFKHAANEAAGVAWTTDFPLLVFPVLFEEFTRRERARDNRQQRIIARTEELLEAVV